MINYFGSCINETIEETIRQSDGQSMREFPLSKLNSPATMTDTKNSLNVGTILVFLFLELLN